MEPRPRYILCFLGQFVFQFTILFWLYSAGGMVNNPGMWMLGFCSFAGFNSGNRAKFHEQWKKPEEIIVSPTKWSVYFLIGLGLIAFTQIWRHFSPSPTPRLVALGTLLYPLAVALHRWLDEIGFHRPFRESRALRSRLASTPTPSIACHQPASPPIQPQKRA